MKKYWDKSQLMRVWRERQLPQGARPVKAGVVSFMKHVVYPRQKRLGELGLAWRQLLPEELVRHSCLENIRRGRLIVLVDSASHLYELSLLVQKGLADQLRQFCPKINLREISLKRGVWYRVDENGQQIPKF